MARETRLVDGYGRLHDNLRVSVTDRCNIRCYYCMPERPVHYVPREDLLTYEEIERFVRIAVSLGIRKVRITGGEPTVRRDLPALVRKLSAIDGLEDLSLTTNGVLLPELAEPLYEAGLRRINIHLDTLDPERFFRITRRDVHGRVLEGIEACRRLGYAPIKINVVVVRGESEPDIIPLARFGRERGLVVRYIEFMPLDGQGLWHPDRVLLGSEILEILQREFGPMRAAPDQDPRSPAVEYVFPDGRGKIGLIRSVSDPFCRSCNRIRLTADGKLRYCLFALEETDIRGLLRGGASDETIAQRIRETVSKKWDGHQIHAANFVPPSRLMHAIGG